MNFQEANHIIKQTTLDLHNGIIDVNVWKAKLSLVEVRDKYGNKWKYFSDSHEWCYKYGKGWRRAVPNGKDPAPLWKKMLRISSRSPIKIEEPSNRLFSYLGWLIKGYFVNLPYTLLFQIITMMAVFFIARFTHSMLYINIINSGKTMAWQTILAGSTRKLIETHAWNMMDAGITEMTWALFGFMISFLAFKAFSGSLIPFFKNLIHFPIWTASCFSNKDRNNLLVLTLSISVAAISGRFFETEHAALIIGILLLISFGSQKSSIIGTVIRLLYSDAKRLINSPVREETSFPYLIVLGYSIGLILFFLLSQHLLLLYVIVGFLIIMGFLIRMTHISKTTIMMLIGLFSFTLFLTYVRQVFADDNSTGDYGGPWNWFIRNRQITSSIGAGAGRWGMGGGLVGGSMGGAGGGRGGNDSETGGSESTSGGGDGSRSGGDSSGSNSSPGGGDGSRSGGDSSGSNSSPGGGDGSRSGGDSSGNNSSPGGGDGSRSGGDSSGSNSSSGSGDGSRSGGDSSGSNSSPGGGDGSRSGGDSSGSNSSPGGGDGSRNGGDSSGSNSSPGGGDGSRSGSNSSGSNSSPGGGDGSRSSGNTTQTDSPTNNGEASQNQASPSRNGPIDTEISHGGMQEVSGGFGYSNPGSNDNGTANPEESDFSTFHTMQDIAGDMINILPDPIKFATGGLGSGKDVFDYLTDSLLPDGDIGSLFQDSGGKVGGYNPNNTNANSPQTDTDKGGSTQTEPSKSSTSQDNSGGMGDVYGNLSGLPDAGGDGTGISNDYGEMGDTYGNLSGLPDAGGDGTGISNDYGEMGDTYGNLSGLPDAGGDGTGISNDYGEMGDTYGNLSRLPNTGSDIGGMQETVANPAKGFPTQDINPSSPYIPNSSVVDRSIDMNPAKSDPIILSPEYAAGYPNQTPPYNQAEPLPAATKSGELTPAIPDQAEPLPAATKSGELTPAIPDQAEPFPAATKSGELTPAIPDQAEPFPAATKSGELTPAVPGQTETLPPATKSGELTPAVPGQTKTPTITLPKQTPADFPEPGDGNTMPIDRTTGSSPSIPDFNTPPVQAKGDNPIDKAPPIAPDGRSPVTIIEISPENIPPPADKSISPGVPSSGGLNHPNEKPL